MSMHANRRRVLQYLSGAGASLLAACASVPGASVRQGKRIVVLGAGLAGLAGAYKLMNGGYDVVVLEGQNRVGGRVLTVREGFAAGGHAEMGATRIFSTHAATLRYIEHFGLGPLVPYDPGNRAFFMRGRRFGAPGAGEPWPVADMSEAERADPFAFLQTYLGAGFAALGDANAPDWPLSEPAALLLDRLTVEQFLRLRGASPGWIDWFCALEGNVKRMNAFVGLATELLLAGFGGEQPASIRGGNDRLPNAFAAALGNRIQLRSKVVQIEQSDREVVVTYLDARGRRQELRADACVCALPFSSLRRVAIATPFSEAKMRAIESLRYMPVARVCFQTRSRFWESDALGRLGGLGLAGGDTFAGRIWNTSSQQADPTLGMIGAYMIDADASQYAPMPERAAALRRHIDETLLPGLSEREVVAAVEKVWTEDPWVEGGWAWTAPGEMTGLFQERARPEARVHFAGEHTSPLVGWMTTAIESGERAADEIMAASAG